MIQYRSMKMVLFHLMDNHGDFHTHNDFQLIITGPEMALLLHHFGVTMTSEGVVQFAMLCAAHQKEHPTSKDKKF